MKKIWSTEEEQFLRDNLATKTYDELSEILGLEKAKIIDKVHKIGLNRKLASGEIWSQSEDDLLAEHFEYAPKNRLMKLFPNRSWAGITQRGYKTLKMNRLTQDRYDIDYNFFAEWSEKTAYIYGFIAADGYIKYENGDRNETSLQFELAGYDKDILYKIKDALQYEGPVSSSNRKTVKLNIANKKICKDLLDKGIPYTKKTYNIKWPETLPSNLSKHFIRGYFDGDGSIYSKDCRVSFQFLGTKEICDKIKEELPILATRNNQVHYKKDYNNGADIYVLQVSNTSTYLIAKYLYDDATIFLDRKYNKMQELFKEFPQNIGVF